MAIVMNLYYTGENGSAMAFVNEMEESGIAPAIRAEAGNLRYDYFQSLSDAETVLLIDMWEDQASLDVHHATPMMGQIMALREKYDLRMRAERYEPQQANTADDKFIRK